MVRPKDESALRWQRLTALGLATVFVLGGVASVSFVLSGRTITDFLSFWAAGRLATTGDAAAAYDLVRHRAIEEQVLPRVGFLPFPYPPPFLLFVAPFGLLSFPIAFAVWVAISATVYVLSVRRWIEPRFALAQAAAAANLIIGQNGFMTSAIFIRGTSLLARRPLIGGALLGLLSVKPQIALLVPVALLAGREWRAILGGLLSSLALLAVSLLLFGIDAYRGFFGILPQYGHWLSAGRWPWGELASPFALLRYLNVPSSAALVIHTMIAAAAVAITARAWLRRLEQRVPILAAAALLIPPYLFTYDALLMTLPLIWLLRSGNDRVTFTLVWLFSVLPVVCYVAPLPNTMSLAAILALWALHKGIPGSVAETHQV